MAACGLRVPILVAAMAVIERAGGGTTAVPSGGQYACRHSSVGRPARPIARSTACLLRGHTLHPSAPFWAYPCCTALGLWRYSALAVLRYGGLGCFVRALVWTSWRSLCSGTLVYCYVVGQQWGSLQIR